MVHARELLASNGTVTVPFCAGRVGFDVVRFLTGVTESVNRQIIDQYVWFACIAFFDRPSDASAHHHRQDPAGGRFEFAASGQGILGLLRSAPAHSISNLIGCAQSRVEHHVHGREAVF